MRCEPNDSLFVSYVRVQTVCVCVCVCVCVRFVVTHPTPGGVVTKATSADSSLNWL